MTQERYTLDLGRYTGDEALELMIHHLTMAHAFYEIADETVTRDEARRIMLADHPAYKDNPKLIGTLAWLDALDKKYAEMKKEDEDLGLS